VWPVLVVMQNVRREDVLDVAAAEDRQPVKALAAQCPDPAFGMRPRLRRPYWRLDHLDTLGAEDLVEVAAELLSRSRTRNRGRMPGRRAARTGCAPAGSPSGRPGSS
jgi:hypothetical protein